MYAIIGLGKTGISIARFLQKQQQAFWIADTREQPPGLEAFHAEFPAIKCYCGQLPEDEILRAACVVISPGLSRQTPEIQKAIQANIPVIGDIELFVRHAQAPIIAITGTNAKGTVTTMIGSILAASGKKVLLGGNIGIPALDLLSQPVPDFYILEISSFQLESTFLLNAVAATILNITDDHLDYHGTMENYRSAKQRVYQNAQNVIYNRDDQRSMPTETAAAVSWTFGLGTPSGDYDFGIWEEEGKTFLCWGKQCILCVDDLTVFGQHNWANALAACALAISVGTPLPALQQGLKEFRGLNHRCELVTEKEGIRWINDSKGTNVGATQAALAGIGPRVEGKIILLAGGLSKEQDLSPLQPLCQLYVKDLILFGQDAMRFEEVLGSIIKTHHVKTLKEAVEIADVLAQPGDVVLLSPVCASLDMFKSYEDRGEQFIELVKKTVEVY